MQQNQQMQTSANKHASRGDMQPAQPKTTLSAALAAACSSGSAVPAPPTVLQSGSSGNSGDEAAKPRVDGHPDAG